MLTSFRFSKHRIIFKDNRQRLIFSTMNTPQDIVHFARNKKPAVLRYQTKISKRDLKSILPFKKHEIYALLFLTIEKPAELCGFLKTHIFKMEYLFNNPYYKHYTIEKKRGGVRDIYVPSPQLKNIQKQLNYYLQAYYLWIKPEEAHGFVINPGYLLKKCNIVENAKNHTGKKYVLNIDLKDFFPGISAWQVKETFMSQNFMFNEQIATALTLLTTYQGCLPTGAPSSPAISNFVCYQLDQELIEYCKLRSLAYSRYADDLTFSSDKLIASDAILDLILLIKKNNFRINEKKLRLQTSNSRQTVTGITVNEKVNVNRRLLKKIRAMLHDLNTNGLEAATIRHLKIKGECTPAEKKFFARRLEGYINFVGQVRGTNDKLYLSFKGGGNALKFSAL